MARKSPRDQAAGVPRRGLLGAGAALPVALAASSAPAAEMPGMAMPAGHSGAIPDIEGLETLTAIESDILEAVCARIVPTDAHGPGAKEARAAHYIDRSLAGAMKNQRDIYAAGLAALDAYARTSKGKPFAKLAEVDQDKVLHDLEANVATGFKPDAASFFTLMRTHTIEGMFCDPYYGGNVNFVGWALIGYPGLRMPANAEDQRLVKPKTLRQSAYSGGMFGRGRG